MNWNRDRSVALSKICVAVFAVLLAALDVGGWWVARAFARLGDLSSLVALLIVLYLCSVFAWITLARLWRLLSNLGRSRVFEAENTGHLRAVSWCCFGVGAVCLAGGARYLPLLLPAVAAAFMGLIVRIVKNVFEHAIAMKSELDLTV